MRCSVAGKARQIVIVSRGPFICLITATCARERGGVSCARGEINKSSGNGFLNFSPNGQAIGSSFFFFSKRLVTLIYFFLVIISAHYFFLVSSHPGVM